MFDFKQIVESILLEEGYSSSGDTKKDYEVLKNNIRTEYGILDITKVEKIAYVSGGLRLKGADFNDLTDAEAVFLNCCVLIRKIANGGAEMKSLKSTKIDDILKAPGVNDEIIRLIDKVNDGKKPFEFEDTNGFSAAIKQLKDLRVLLGNQLIQKNYNSTLLNATVNIVKANLKKDYSTYIIDIFYNPEKYKTGSTLPNELRSDLEDLTYLSLYTGFLYEKLTGKSLERESLLLPAILFGGPIALKFLGMTKDALFNAFRHLANDKDYVKFIREGKIGDKIYTVKTILDLKTKESEAVMETLKDLAFHTNTGETASQKIATGVVKGLESGLGGAAKW
jgi:hypothetical protein